MDCVAKELIALMCLVCCNNTLKPQRNECLYIQLHAIAKATHAYILLRGLQLTRITWLRRRIRGVAYIAPGCG